MRAALGASIQTWGSLSDTGEKTNLGEQMVASRSGGLFGLGDRRLFFGGDGFSPGRRFGQLGILFP